MAEKIIDFASRLNKPTPEPAQEEGFVDFASKLKPVAAPQPAPNDQPRPTQVARTPTVGGVPASGFTGENPFAQRFGSEAMRPREQQQASVEAPQQGIALPQGVTAQQIEDNRRKAVEGARGTPGQFSLGPLSTAATVTSDLMTRASGDVFETDDTRNLPRLSSVSQATESGRLFGKGFNLGGLGKDIQRGLARITASSPEELVQQISSIDEGSQFRFDEMGNIIVTFSDGKEGVLNPPGMDFTDVLKMASEIAKFAPASRAATVARRIGGSALTATAQEAGSAVLGGEFEPSEIITETALAGAGEAGGPLVSRVINQRRARAAGAPVSEIAGLEEVVEEGRRASGETGIDLFRAQQTISPAELQRQATVTQLPAGVQTSLKALRRQNEQAANAVEEFMLSIAKPETIGTAAGRVRTAAQNSIELAKRRRSEAAKFGEAVFQSDAAKRGQFVNLDKVRSTVNSIADEAPKGGDLEKTMNRISNFLELKGDRKFKSFRELQRVKKELDGIMDKVGEGAVAPDIKIQVREIRDQLLDEMDKASGAFKQAREIFALESPGVNALEESVIGRIAKLDDTQLKSVTNTIFNPEVTNVADVTRARKAIQEVDPAAWKEIVRAELENRIGKMRPGSLESAERGLTVENVPQQLFSAIFGNEKQSRALFSALNPQQSQNLKYLQTALGRARLGRTAGSPTATRAEIIKEFQEGIPAAISKLFSPVKATGEAISQIDFDRRVKAVTEALFDPKWEPQMKELRKINIKTPTAAKKFTQLIDEIIAETSEPQPPQETEQ